VEWSEGACGEEQGVQRGGEVCDGFGVRAGRVVVESGLVMLKKVLLKISKGFGVFRSKFGDL
jgi:hypothetical protein